MRGLIVPLPLGTMKRALVREVNDTGPVAVAPR